jgi:ParB/RepB/Spo0J family partition protein
MTTTTTRPKAPARVVQCPHCGYSAEPGSSIAGHVAMAHPDVPMDTVAPKRSARNDERSTSPRRRRTGSAASGRRDPRRDPARARRRRRQRPRRRRSSSTSSRPRSPSTASCSRSRRRSAVDGRYSLLWGQRRVLAARKAGLATIPALVVAPTSVDDRPTRSVEQLVENLHRADLNPIDRARAMRAVVDSGVSQADLARKLGIAPSTVANDLGLLDAPAPVQQLLESTELTPAHVKAMKGLAPKTQVELAKEVVDRGYSAHRTEVEVQDRKRRADAERRARTEAGWRRARRSARPPSRRSPIGRRRRSRRTP